MNVEYTVQLNPNSDIKIVEKWLSDLGDPFVGSKDFELLVRYISTGNRLSELETVLESFGCVVSYSDMTIELDEPTLNVRDLFSGLLTREFGTNPDHYQFIIWHFIEFNHMSTESIKWLKERQSKYYASWMLLYIIPLAGLDGFFESSFRERYGLKVIRGDLMAFDEFCKSQCNIYDDHVMLDEFGKCKITKIKDNMFDPFDFGWLG